MIIHANAPHRCLSATAAIVGAVEDVINNGRVITSTKDTTIMVNNHALVFVADKINVPQVLSYSTGVDKKVSTKFALAEAAYILAGRDDDGIAKDFPFMAKYLVDGRMIGSYGPYFKKQLLSAVDKLAADPATRQAVVTVWPVNDAATRDKYCVDMPCTNYFAFYTTPVGSGRHALHLTVVHRSSDTLLGLTYDVTFQQLLLHIVRLFLPDMEIGTITNIAINRHIYMAGSGIHGAVDDGNWRDFRVVSHKSSTFNFNQWLTDVLGCDASCISEYFITSGFSAIYNVAEVLYTAAICGMPSKYFI